LAIPIIFASLLQTVYNLTDTFWVGRLGADSVAAVSISFPIIFFLWVMSRTFLDAFRSGLKIIAKKVRK
jgi:Na+-driven multidrug efflux pump